MRSIVHDTFGEPADVLSLADIPVPEPGPGEARVRTILSTIHNHDLWTVRGWYGQLPTLPATAGSEAVGVVDAVGAGVDAGFVGQRVASGVIPGAWAEFFVAPAATLIPVPDSVDDETGAQLIAMPFSALTLLEFIGAKFGDWIIQNAANGAVGKTLAAFAAARGIHTINLVRRDEAIAELAAYGIGNAVSTAQPDWKEQVRALAGGRITAAIDSISGPGFDDLADLVDEHGILVSSGALTAQPFQANPSTVIYKQLTIKGYWAAPAAAALSEKEQHRLFGELITLAAQGAFALPVEAVFNLADFDKAVAASLATGRRGKVLLRP